VVLQIVKYPDPILKKKAEPVDKISKEIFILADDMIETMLKNDGLGLAATQVSSPLRLFVINVSLDGDTPKPMVVINPRIISEEDVEVHEEGCLSFPDLYLNIERPQKVRIYAKDLYNENTILDATGLLARAIMHEIDHLDGVLFIERVAQRAHEEQKKIEKYLETLSQNSKPS
jgi:peptide deformylase